MRVLHVITSLNIGGAEKLMVDLLPQLKAKGVDAELLLFVGNRTMFYEQLEKENVKIHLFSESGSAYDPRHIFRLYRFLKKHKYDIIHTHNTAPQIFAAIVSMLLPLNLITTEHNTTNRRRNWKLYKVIDKWMYNRYNRVICISNAAEVNLKNYLQPNKRSDRYLTILNGVDISKFENAKPLSMTSTKTSIVMVAGFRPQKDQDTIIRALRLLPKEKFELWLVGDGERRGELEELVASEGVAENTKFWGIRADVASIIKSADIVVMSSHYEGLSLSSVEGMSVGKPFIASDVDGLHEITEGAGLLFNHGDNVQLANLIVELANDSELYRRVADQCLIRAQQYDISKMVDGYINVYRSL